MEAVRKIYLDKDKEEVWINEMCSNGMHLVKRKGRRYIFEEGEPGKYVYKIEIAEHTKQSKNKSFLYYLNERDIELVDTASRWMYFRRNALKGDYKVYTDVKSKIRIYKLVSDYKMGIAALLLMLSVSGIRLFIDMFAIDYTFKLIDAVISAIAVFGVTSAVVSIVSAQPVRRRLRALKSRL